MTVLSLGVLKATAIRRYGTDPKEWRFKCPSCGAVQSRASVEQGLRHEPLMVETRCYSCGHHANDDSEGLLVVIDRAAPYDSKLLENCTRVFPLENEDFKNWPIDERLKEVPIADRGRSKRPLSEDGVAAAARDEVK